MVILSVCLSGWLSVWLSVCLSVCEQNNSWAQKPKSTKHGRSDWFCQWSVPKYRFLIAFPFPSPLWSRGLNASSHDCLCCHVHRLCTAAACSAGVTRRGSVPQCTALMVLAATEPTGFAAVALSTMQGPWRSLNSLRTDFLVAQVISWFKWNLIGSVPMRRIN